MRKDWLLLSPERKMTTLTPLDRASLAAQYLRGSGIEIGALHHPLPVPKDVSVRCVDRLPVSELRIQYPELSAYDLVPVDIVDDGECLQTIPDASQDFVIANHFLEHTEDPIGTLLNFFRVLREGGFLYMAIPDKRFTFDVDRPVTTLQHLIRDHAEGPAHSREAHYREWVRLVDKASGIAGEEALYKERTEKNYSIHFHVWRQQDMAELIAYMHTLTDFEELEQVTLGWECIFVLRKIPMQA